MRYKLASSACKKKTEPRTYTVEAEYLKYVLGNSSDDIDILWFWEVSGIIIEWLCDSLLE
jgi:hypothetical protein